MNGLRAREIFKEIGNLTRSELLDIIYNYTMAENIDVEALMYSRSIGTRFFTLDKASLLCIVYFIKEAERCIR